MDKVCACGCGRPVKLNRTYLRGHCWRGRHHSEDEKKRISDSEHGKYVSKESKEKNAEAHRGKVYSEETRLKKSLSLKRYYSVAINRTKAGHTQTAEEKEKRSKSMKSFYATPEGIATKMQSSLKRRGTKRSEETRRKLSENKKEYYSNPLHPKSPSIFKEGHPCLLEHHSEETKKILSDIHKGELNPCWNGGSSFLPYPTTFNDELKRRIRERDSYICQLCSNPTRLRIHHIDCIKENCSPENLITLCNGCNGKVNKDRSYWTNHFRSKLQLQEAI